MQAVPYFSSVADGLTCTGCPNPPLQKVAVQVQAVPYPPLPQMAVHVHVQAVSNPPLLQMV